MENNPIFTSETRLYNRCRLVALEEKAEATKVKMIEGFCIKNCYDDANDITVDPIRGDEQKSRLIDSYEPEHKNLRNYREAFDPHMVSRMK